MYCWYLLVGRNIVFGVGGCESFYSCENVRSRGSDFRKDVFLCIAQVHFFIYKWLVLCEIVRKVLHP